MTTHHKGYVLDSAATGTHTITVNAEGASNDINVGVQLNKGSGKGEVDVRTGLFCYLSDDANGDSVAGTAPDGGVAIGTDGVAIPVVAGKAFYVISESDGDFDLTVTESSTDTWYLVVVSPNGTLQVSDAITF